jgi:hypothetical protein
MAGMDTAGSKRAPGLAAAMLVLALVLGPGLPQELSKWEALSDALRIFDVAFLAAVVVLVASAAVLLVWPHGSRAALVGGSAAGLVLAGGLMLGSITGVIPCSGPS